MIIEKCRELRKSLLEEKVGLTHFKQTATLIMDAIANILNALSLSLNLRNPFLQEDLIKQKTSYGKLNQSTLYLY